MVLVCGKENKVVNVSEPKTCEYEMEFRTPLACSRRNMAGECYVLGDASL